MGVISLSIAWWFITKESIALAQRFSILLIGILGATVSCALASSITKPQLEKICREEGGLKTKGTLTVEGYFQSSKISDTFGFHDVATKLIKERFSYIESDQKYWTDQRTGKRYVYDYEPLNKRAVGKGTKYYRYYLAPAGSPACAGYEDAIKSTAFTLPGLRKMGLPSSLCIASEKTDSLKGEYELVSKREETSTPVPIRWARYQVRKVQDGEVMAQYSSFKHCFGKSVVESGGNTICIGNEESYVCHNPKEYLAFFESAFKAVPNNVLPQSPKLVEASQPNSVSVQQLADGMIEQLRGREGYVPDQVYWKLTHPVDRDGALSFEGDKLVILNDGAIRKVPVTAEGRGLQLHMALKGTDSEIWVISGNWLNGLANRNNEWWALKYSWNGQQLAAYKFYTPPITWKGDVMHRFDNLEVKPGGLTFSILDFDKVNSRFNIEAAYTLSLKLPATPK